jgi:hypothetical protein
MLTVRTKPQWLQQLKVAQQQAKAAQDSVSATQDQMRLSERAWMSITMGAISKPVEGQRMSIPVTITNTGKTVAKRITLMVRIRQVENTLAAEKAMIFSYDEPGTFSEAVGFLAPNDAPLTQEVATMEIDPATKYPRPILLSHTNFERLNNSVDFMLAYAQLTYFDIFGVQHWVRSCVYVLPPSNGAYARKCTDYRDIDNNK